ncbi:formylmethanofuran--tetrahydromethanopterin N-formyltransferase [soil metagenome]
MMLNGVEIVDTFAEAFPMSAARVIVTAATAGWAMTAATTATGYASSVIGCDAEAGIEEVIEHGPDGRPGVAMLFFAFSRDALQKAIVNRVANCILTCASTAVYNGILDGDAGKNVKVGGSLRYFGDGWQISKLLNDKRYWRIPTMDGEFLCEDEFGTVKGVAGGNFLILGETQASTLAAAEAAVTAIRTQCKDVILPFPGGIVRSGSKVGSKYKTLRASTNEGYCPTLRGVVNSELPAGVNCVYEIVIDGLTLNAVEDAMLVGIRAACVPGVKQISAGNYGGKLGPHHIQLHSLLQD